MDPAGGAGVFAAGESMTNRVQKDRCHRSVELCIPWKGYFDLISRCDEFVLYDDVQFAKRDWRNRNRIKTHDGLHWLSIPVNVSGRYFQAIKDVTISNLDGTRGIGKRLRPATRRRPISVRYRERLEELYRGATDTSLSAINHRFLVGLCEIIGLHTRITWSMDYRLSDGRRSGSPICAGRPARPVISGPSAKAYIEPAVFEACRRRASSMDYTGYREYYHNCFRRSSMP